MLVAFLLQAKKFQSVQLTVGEKCPYKDTIDLSDKMPLINGSYIYENVLIPRDQVAEYKYRLFFADNALEAEGHLRGCVCGRPKRCVKMCCEREEFFNEDTLACERIPEYMEIPDLISITMFNGICCYFFFISAYLWLSVLCIDNWIHFKDVNKEFSRTKQMKRFCFYSLYAWGTALAFTTIVIWADWSDTVPENLKPGVGTDACWLDTNMWSSAIYFYGPNLLIILSNIAIFLRLSFYIYRVQSDVAIVLVESLRD
ncbi:G-protein coupled receptor Mth2-like [Musca vetustissima]|uniref:G-protein coupled receptor Mth2-like n=1 Tax=Musca vetustissima TaxID=27455 RepID=UPI002AB67BEE|nr:G-protein coupled receptor Mth2-like [Musca vetustissima]